MFNDIQYKHDTGTATVNGWEWTPSQVAQAITDSFACCCGDCICCRLRSQFVEARLYEMEAV